MSARSNDGGVFEKVGSGGTVSFRPCEPNSGAAPSGAVAGRGTRSSPAIDLDLPLEAVVSVLFADGVLLWIRGLCPDDLALLVIEGANLVRPVSFLGFTPRSLLELLGFELLMPGNGGNAQS